MKNAKLALFGFLILILGIILYLIGVFMSPLRWISLNNPIILNINEVIVWYSGIPLVIGTGLICLELLLNVGKRRGLKSVESMELNNNQLTVVLTAYNDELSIAKSIKDFQSHHLVKRVIVISNNSVDKTMEVAKNSGAIVYNEENQGYGACVHRALSESIKYDDTVFTILCEGDMTFRASDIDKFVAYIPHADVVVGSRIVEKLQDRNTQLSMFMHYGNFFVGKLLEIKYLGMVTLTDVGTTYKLCRNDLLKDILPKLDPNVNLEFNPYFLDKVLEYGYNVVEIPITFFARIGESKGGNQNNLIAFKLGLSMIWGIVFNWKGIENDRR
jgi:glycosyltransferase involved in cell wall biosynthesis